MAPAFESTYLGLDVPHRWLRGNHHGHSTISDGEDEPLDILTAYEAEGYDYMALSEHDRLLDPGDLQPHTSMCILPAVEVTACSGQTLMYLGADRELPGRRLTPVEIMRQVRAAGGLFVWDHPNWRPWPEYTTDAMLGTMDGMRGMEIYTGVIESLPGEAKATDRWDRMLSKGWRVFGHGTDDQHGAQHHFVAWNQVQWPEGEPVTPGGIVNALAEGRFYASTGVTIRRVGITEDRRSAVVESDADEIRWIVRDGRIVSRVRGGCSRLTTEELLRLPAVAALSGGEPQDVLYLRAECLGRGNAAAWTQPYWISN